MTAPAPTPIPPELSAHPHYQDVRALGEGGMGVVYLATNRLMGRPEVLKVVGKRLLARPGAAERFLREIRSAARLHHQNIVTAYTALEAGDLLVFAMEYVPGRNLADEVKASGPLPVANACHYAAQVAQGLQHAHERGMVHRDIKPGNLMLTREGTRHAVKILDFGLAKAVHDAAGSVDGELTGDGKMMGTPDYMSPEQILDAARADIRADIYSLGCTLYYLLAGRAPFTGATLYALLHAHQTAEALALNLARAEVPPELAAVVARMMAKDPAKRYQTPAEVARTLAPFAKSGSKPASESPQIKAATVQPKSAAEQPPVAPIAPASAWQTLTGAAPPAAPLPPAPLPRARPVRAAEPTPAPAAVKPTRGRRWLWPAVAAGIVAVALGGAVVGGVFKAKLPRGTVVVTNVPDGAEVALDGATVTRNGDTVTLTEVPADGKGHRLRVRKGGVELFAQDVTLTPGGGAAAVRYEGKKPEPAVAVAAKPEPVVASAPGPDPGAGGAAKPNQVGAPPAGSPARVALTSGPGTWRRDGDRLVARGLASLWFGNPDWGDLDFSYHVSREAADAGTFGFVRLADVFNRVQFSLGSTQHQRSSLYKLIDNRRSVLDEVAWRTPAKQSCRVLIRVRGDFVEGFVDGQPVLGAKAGGRQGGYVGFGASSGVAGGVGTGLTVFSDVKVTDPAGNVLWEGPPVLPPAAPPRGNADEVFTGTNLDGWRRVGGRPETWSVQDAELVGAAPGPQPAPGFLLLDKQDGDFVLRFEYNLELGGVAGVVLRGSDGEQLPPADGTAAPAHPTIRLSNSGYTLRWLRDGRADDDPTPVRPQPRPAGRWRLVEVTVVGDRCSVREGVGEVLNVRLDPDPAAHRGIVPGLKRPTGRVGFQVEGGTIRLRHIGVKEIPPGTAGQVAGGDARARWAYTSVAGPQAGAGVFRQAGDKAWFESAADADGQRLFWLTETDRTAGYVELERPEGAGKVVVRLYADHADVGNPGWLRRFHAGGWDAKADPRAALDLSEQGDLAAWRFGDAAQVKASADGLVVSAAAGENFVLSRRDDFADCEAKVLLSAAKGADAILVMRAAKAAQWKALASRVYVENDRVVAGMQSNMVLAEEGTRRESIEFDRPFALRAQANDKTAWVWVNGERTSGVTYTPPRFCPAAGAGGLVVNRGAATVRMLDVRALRK